MRRFCTIFLVVLVTFSLIKVPLYADAESPDGVLRNRSQGEEVVNLQMRLRDLGYFNYKVTGHFGSATTGAVRLFQEINGLNPDGVAGPQTQGRLYSIEAIRYTALPNKASEFLPVSRGGRSSLGVIVDWFKSGRYIFPRGAIARVIDLKTGRSFNVKRTGGSNHADSEPVSSDDARTIREVWGGWDWERRAVIVEIGGARIAASMNGMPHGYEAIGNNAMQGHLCIHFYNSRLHANNRECPEHQAMVRRAAGR